MASAVSTSAQQAGQYQRIMRPCPSPFVEPRRTCEVGMASLYLLYLFAVFLLVLFLR